MMEIGSIITLDNKDNYMLLNKTMFEGSQYVLLINTIKSDNFFIAKLENNEIKELNDPDLIIKLSSIFINENK